MDTLDDIAKDLDEMAATLDRVDEGEYWADTPADIAEIYRNFARRIRSCANLPAPSGGAPEARKSRRQETGPSPANLEGTR